MVYTVSRVGRVTFFSSRASYTPKTKPTAPEGKPFGFVFGVQLVLRQTPALIITYTYTIIIIIQDVPSMHLG